MSASTRIAILDVDGTLTRVASPWQYLHERLGLWDTEGRPILDRYLAGESSYDDFCAADAALWNREGLTLEAAGALLDQIPLRPAATGLLRELAEREVAILLLSTGFVRVARRILEAAGSPPARILANDMIAIAGGRLAPRLDVSADRDDPRSKPALAGAATRELGLRPAEVLLVGDRKADLDLLGPRASGVLVRDDRDLTTVHEHLAAGR